MEQEQFTSDKACKHEGQWYAAGRELCIDNMCMVCRDGKWKDSSSGFYPGTF